jgi:hypothetical protein
MLLKRGEKKILCKKKKKIKYFFVINILFNIDLFF